MSSAAGDLLRGCSAAELVRGDAAGVDRLAQQLLGLSDLFADAAQALGRIEVAWSGAAADAFRAEFQLQPGAFVAAAKALSDAGFALGSHALTLDSARAMAVLAIELWQAGMRAAKAAVLVAGPLGPVAEPLGDAALLQEPAGAQQRMAAVEKLDLARSQVERSGAKAAAALRSAVAAAPEWTSAWQHLGNFVTDAGSERHEFFAGALEGVLFSGSAVNPLSWLTDGLIKEQVNQFEWDHGVDPGSGWHTAGSILGPSLLGVPGLVETAASKPVNILLYRGMRADADGWPQVGNTAKTLGVRIEGEFTDIDPDRNGMVWPRAGGMSANTTLEGIKDFRKPADFGGTAKDLKMYSIYSDQLDSRLGFVPDAGSHGTIQPSSAMTADQYRSLLAGTRERWTRVEP